MKSLKSKVVSLKSEAGLYESKALSFGEGLGEASIERGLGKASRYRPWTMVHGLLLLLLALCANALTASAQLTISYSTGSAIFTTGTAITPLTLTTGGGTFGVNGQTATIAGNGVAGYQDGTGWGYTSFNGLSGAVADALGNFYIADAGNNRIRKIAVYTGTVTTFAGSGTAGAANGTGTAASFNNPTGVAIDASGNLYVADANNELIRKITPAGVVTTLAGTAGSAGSTDGTGTAAKFSLPYGVVTDGSGNLYVADDNNNKIRKIVISTAVVTTFAGSGTAGSANGTGTAATFNHPTGVACDAAGNVYVADRQNNMIRKITTAAVVTTFAGATTAGAVDGTGTAARFSSPASVTLDASGNVYVADQANNTIRAITTGGVVSTLAGYYLASGAANGPGGSAQFYTPVGVTADKFGNLAVCDSHFDNIRQVAYSTYAIYPYLPAGLSFNLANGTISGTPAEMMAATQFSVTAYSGSFSANTTITLEVLSSTPVVGPTLTNNYVISNSPRKAGIINDSTLSVNANNRVTLQTGIQYVDGLGRSIQTIQEQASPLGYDMVVPQAYDSYGREVRKFLPYAPEIGLAGNFRPNAATAGDSTFYASPPAGSNMAAITDPFANTAFDNSPLNRPVEQGAPGVAWQLTTSGITGSGHTVKMVYTENNATSFAADSINGRQASLYYTTTNGDFTQTLHAGGYYAAGELTVTVMKDENWVSGRAGTVEEYKDIDGHVVLKRQYNDSSSVVQMLSTYYVYDDMGRLVYVLPPLSGADADGIISTTTLNNLCYQYQYDERGRPVQKKLPGKGWEYTVYNTMDQPVATQDALQLGNNQWIFTKYDVLGRVVETGIWNNGGSGISRANLKIILDAITTNLYESAITTGNGYTNVAWPTTNVTTTLSINYYDGYSNMPGMPTAYTAPTGANLATRGELTGTQTNVLGSTNMLWTAHYYDNWGRGLESYAQHYLNGTINANRYDAITTTYSFTNIPTTVTRKHWTAASMTYPMVTIFNRYRYDPMDRRLNSWEQLTNSNNTPDTLRLIANTAYNEIGQLKFKNLHSKDSVNYLQQISYGYNERGWLTNSFAPLFAMTLYYNTNSGNKAYNGNIMYQYWGVPGNLSNHYTYTYDELNRLVSGVTSADNYQESGIVYDTEGNITALNRYSAGTQVDQLSYHYNNKNSLDSVNDAKASNLGLVSGTTKYTYDGNGNMLTAANTVNTGQNKSFTYNLLNLPLVVTTSTGTATYTYDAAGNKLRKVSVQGGVTSNTDYIGGIQYNGSGTTDTLNFIQTEEGKAVKQGNGINYEYVYYLGDNLGNTRITFGTKTGIATTLQQDDYYPFGLEISRGTVPNPKNEYLYNKKELQEEFNEYDYGARYYDPVIGRWNTIDPLAEAKRRWSPFNFVENDPIRLTDPDGMKVDTANQQEWNTQKQNITNQRNNFNNAIADLNALSQSTGADLSGLVSGLRDRVNSLDATLTNLTNLEASPQVYGLNKIGVHETGGTSLNTHNNEIIFSFGTTANFVHETTHGGQFESNDIAFNTASGNTLGMDVGDEVAAYKAQYAYDPSSVSLLNSSSIVKSVNDITSSWVQGLIEPNGNRPYSVGGSDNTSPIHVDMNTRRDVLILAYPNAPFLRTQSPGFTLKSFPGIYYKH